MSHQILTPTCLSSPLILKSLQEAGRFSGYASVFNTLDNQGDRVLKGAFQKSLQKGVVPKMLWQHDAKEPIGFWQALQEDANGLYVEGQLLLDLQKGREAYSLLKTGVLDGLSIGCAVKKADFSEKDGARELKEVDLLEISLVTFAANADAKVLAFKGQEPTPALTPSDLYQNPHPFLREVSRAITVLRT